MTSARFIRAPGPPQYRSRIWNSQFHHQKSPRDPSQMTDRSAPNEWLATCDMEWHSALGRDTDLFQRVLQCQGIDDRGQHPHVVPVLAQCAFTPLQASKNVPATDHDDYLHSRGHAFSNLLSNVIYHPRIKCPLPDSPPRASPLFEQNAAIMGLERAWYNLLGAAKQVVEDSLLRGRNIVISNMINAVYQTLTCRSTQPIQCWPHDRDRTRL